jgi:hypothetical protein
MLIIGWLPIFLFLNLPKAHMSKRGVFRGLGMEIFLIFECNLITVDESTICPDPHINFAFSFRTQWTS